MIYNLKGHSTLDFQSLVLILCGKQSEIELEDSLLQTSALLEAKTIHTTQANEMSVCAECSIHNGENFRIK